MPLTTPSAEFLRKQATKPRWYFVKQNWARICVWTRTSITLTSFTQRINLITHLSFNFTSRHIQRDGRTRFDIYVDNFRKEDTIERLKQCLPRNFYYVRQHREQSFRHKHNSNSINNNKHSDDSNNEEIGNINSINIEEMNTTQRNPTILCWNCRSISNKIEILRDTMSTTNPCIIFLQETFRDNPNKPFLIGGGHERWEIFEQPCITNAPVDRGILTAVKTHSRSSMLYGWKTKRINTEGDRFMIVIELIPPTLTSSITSSSPHPSPPTSASTKPLILINIYLTARHSDRKKQRETFQSAIRKLTLNFPHHQYVLAGDFNMKTLQAKHVLSPFAGMIEKSTLSSFGLTYTHTSSRHSTTGEIDHVWTTPSLLPITTAHLQSESDHNYLTIELRNIKQNSQIHPSLNSPTENMNGRTSHKRMDPRKVIANAHKIKDSNYFSPLAEIEDTEECWREFRSATNRCAEELKLYYNDSHNPTQRSPLSKKSKGILKKRNKLKRKLVSTKKKRSKTKRDEIAAQMKELTKELRLSIKKERILAYANSKLRVVDPLTHSGHVIEAWKTMLAQSKLSKKRRNKKTSTNTYVQDPSHPELPINTDIEVQKRIWWNHYDHTFGPSSITPTDGDDDENSKDEHENDRWKRILTDPTPLYQIDKLHHEDENIQQFEHPLPTQPPILALNSDLQWKECKEHIRRLGERKAPGEDGIISELLKLEFMGINEKGPNLFDPAPNSEIGKAIWRILLNVWEGEKIPKDWKTSIIHPIPKCPNPTTPSDYRPISLVPTALKLLTSIISSRILLHGQDRLAKEQGGFRNREECVSQAIVLHDLIQNAKKNNCLLFGCFLDLQAAFDSVPHPALFTSLESFGVTGKALSIIKDIYTGSVCKIRIDDQNTLTEEIPIKKGVKQGDPLSPILFIIFINSLPTWLKSRNLGAHLNNNLHTKVSCLLYADDIVLTSTSQAEMDYMLDLTTLWLDQRNMRANPKKCAIVYFNQNTIQHPESAPDDDKKWIIQNNNIERGTSYKYLGLEFNEDLDLNKMAEARAEAGRKAAQLAHQFLVSPTQPIHCKRLIINSVLIPVTTYGCALWSIDPTSQLKTKEIIEKATALICRIRQPTTTTTTITTFSPNSPNEDKLSHPHITMTKQSKTAAAAYTLLDVIPIDYYMDMMKISMLARIPLKKTWIIEAAMDTGKRKWIRKALETLNSLIRRYTMDDPPIESFDIFLLKEEEEVEGAQHPQTDNEYLASLLRLHKQEMKAWNLNNCKAFSRTHPRRNEQLYVARCIRSCIRRYPLLSHGIEQLIKLMVGDLWTNVRQSHALHIDPSTAPCPHCKTGHSETIAHYLGHCPTWSLARELTFGEKIMKNEALNYILQTLHQPLLETSNKYNLLRPKIHPNPEQPKPTPYQQLIASHISKHTTIYVRAAAFLLLTRKRRWKQQMYTPATSKKAALRPADQKSILDFFSPPHNLDPHK